MLTGDLDLIATIAGSAPKRIFIDIQPDIDEVADELPTDSIAAEVARLLVAALEDRAIALPMAFPVIDNDADETWCSWSICDQETANAGIATAAAQIVALQLEIERVRNVAWLLGNFREVRALTGGGELDAS